MTGKTPQLFGLEIVKPTGRQEDYFRKEKAGNDGGFLTLYDADGAASAFQ